MNKKMLAILIAGLTLLSVSLAGCSKDADDETGTETGTGSEITTGTASDVVTNTPYESGNQDDPGTSPSEVVTSAPKEDETLEEDPTFTDVDKQVYVYKAQINIRSKTNLGESSICGYAAEGDLLTVTGESQKWYRIKYGEQTCYISKSVACDKALIDAFTAVDNETATISGNVYVRTAPLSDTDSTKDNDQTILKKGETVTLTGVTDKWARISYNGQTRYISLDCVTRAASSETAPETETPTEAQSE